MAWDTFAAEESLGTTAFSKVDRARRVKAIPLLGEGVGSHF